MVKLAQCQIDNGTRRSNSIIKVLYYYLVYNYYALDVKEKLQSHRVVQAIYYKCTILLLFTVQL